MSKAVFISDLHLQNATEKNAVLLIELLERLARDQVNQLFLLGDIFDLWIADHEFFLNQFAPIIKKLNSLRESGIEIHYFEGNHDIDLRPYFEDKMGFIVHEGPFFTHLYGKLIRIEHGDQMDPNDRGYLFLRWLLRTHTVRFLGRNLPSSVVAWIGKTASQKSRNYTTGIRNKIGERAVEEKLVAHANRVYNQFRFDVLIAGHVHSDLDRALLVNGHKARIINLGTWLTKPKLFILSDERADLIDVQIYLSQPKPQDKRINISPPT